MHGVWWWSSSTICPSAPSTTSRRVRNHPIETQPLGEVRQTRSGRQAFRSGRDRCTSVPTATHPILRLSISVRSDLHRMARSPRRTNGSCAGVRMLLTTRRGSRRDRDPSREALLPAEKGGRPVRPAVLLKGNWSAGYCARWPIMLFTLLVMGTVVWLYRETLDENGGAFASALVSTRPLAPWTSVTPHSPSARRLRSRRSRKPRHYPTCRR